MLSEKDLLCIFIKIFRSYEESLLYGPEPYRNRVNFLKAEFLRKDEFSSTYISVTESYQALVVLFF